MKWSVPVYCPLLQTSKICKCQLSNKMRSNASSRTSSFKAQARKYKYVPLGNTPGNIRLLRLSPATESFQPLRGTLFSTHLQDAVPYTALSYTWGDKDKQHFIHIGDEILAVTVNLRDALLRLRSQFDPLVVWVDAICINQEDIRERNNEIAKMRAVYQHAEGVAVWLGRKYKESREALQLVHDLNSSSFEDAHNIIINEERTLDFIALVKLFRRQYWWRIWVIQEISSAKRSTVYCGPEEIPWDELENVCDVLTAHQDALHSVFYKHLSYARTLMTGGPRGLQLSRYSPSLAAPPLLELLVSHKSKESTDPRDKVYALVGMSSSRDTFGSVDYSHPLAEIYTHTARHIISTTRKLDVICVKQHDVAFEGLPSWAPDWTRPRASAGATVIGLHHHLPEFTSAGKTFADVTFSPNSNILTASGLVLGKISTTGMPLIRTGSLSDAAPALHVFHDWWNLFVSSHFSAPSAQALFARIISCGNWSFDNNESYSAKLETIFTLSDEILSGSDVLRLDPPSRASTFSGANTMSDSVQSLRDYEEDDKAWDSEEREQYSNILTAALTMNRRRLFISDDRLAGLAPWNAASGDIICILLGCRFPVILRRVQDDYELIGEAYVDGFMDGQGIDALNRREYELQTFNIR